MNDLNFFLEISKQINCNAEEVTIVGNTVEENLFNSKDVPADYLIEFINAMANIFGEAIDVDKLQQFSFQPADGITYSEHKFMAVYSGGTQDCKLYDSSITTPHDDYCINYFIDTKKTVVKFYDLDVWKHQQPNILRGSQLLTHWGQGVGTNSLVKDLYFLHNDVEAVAKFYNLPVPFEQSISEFCKDTSFMKVFGLTYDAQSFNPRKLKLYYYPKDPTMSTTVFDEIYNSYEI